MTIKEVCKQIYDLSVGGYFNGEKFTLERLTNQIKSMFKGQLKGGNRLVQQIALPDGWWYFYIVEYEKGQFDYYIPDTREQEKKVIAILD
jgi:hypothetical protein